MFSSLGRNVGGVLFVDSMKYIKMDWPEIQDYMARPDYPEECYFDPQKNFWFIPEQWVTS